MSSAFVTIGEYPDYRDAQAVVDRLSDEGFPVATTRIVGTDVMWVEDVLGRKGYLGAAGEGAVTGAWIGLVVGLVVGLFDFVEPLATSLSLAWWGLVIGSAAGAVAGAIGHAMLRGRRDFASVGRFVASVYRVEVRVDLADRARSLLPTG